MNFDVPQYIDVEDKIAFQLTAKQLGWFAVGGVLIFFAWNFASKPYFIIWSIFIVLGTLAMAFLKPYGLTVASFIGYGFLFIIKPKQIIWQRNATLNKNDKIEVKIKKETTVAKDTKQIDQMAKILDSKKFL